MVINPCHFFYLKRFDLWFFKNTKKNFLSIKEKMNDNKDDEYINLDGNIDEQSKIRIDHHDLDNTNYMQSRVAVNRILKTNQNTLKYIK